MLSEEYRIYRTTLILIIIAFLILIGIGALASSKENTVDITIHNPARPSFSVEAKCDWNNQLQDFEFYKKIYLAGKTNIHLIVPKKYKKCEIWPKLEKLF